MAAADGEARLDVLQGDGALVAQGRPILLDIPTNITCKAESRGVIVGVKSPIQQSSFNVALGQVCGPGTGPSQACSTTAKTTVR